MNKIVIEISDTLMEYIIQGRDLSEEQNDEMACAIVDGTPLPKNHGRLIDLNDLYDFDRRKVEYAPTIIERSESE